MTWKLVNEKGDTFVLPIGKVITVSRKVGDLILAGDQSVSREHAYLQVGSSLKDGVSLWDTKSKFGTFVNEDISQQTKLKPSDKVTLKEGDKIRFGLQHNVWKLVYEALSVCSSSLSANERRALAEILSQIGAKLQDKWTNESCYLTMNAVSLTIKVVCALACGKPIVTPAFWQSYKDGVRNHKGLPKFIDFIPPLTDVIDRSKEKFLPTVARKSLFKDKVFVFPTAKQLQKFGCAVEFAGGKAVELSAGMSVKELSNPNVVVVLYSGSESDMPRHYQNILNKLPSIDKQVTTEKDIGLAILDVSVEIFSKPTHKNNDLLLAFDKLKSESDMDVVVAADTEDSHVVPKHLQSNSELSDILIPPSYSSTHSSMAEVEGSMQPGSSLKRSRKLYEEQESSAKGSMLDSGSATMEYSNIKQESQTEHEESVLKEDSARNDISFQVGHAKPTTSSFDSSSNINSKSNNDFIFPSPPKAKKRKKKTKTFENSDDSDMFDLPLRPTASHDVSKIEDEDIFQLNSCSSNQAKNSAACGSIDKSRDIFDQSEDIFGSSKPNMKRKVTDKEAAIADPPAKRFSKDPVPSYSTGFLSKSTAPIIKQEVNGEDLDSDAAILAAEVRDKVVVETAPLIVRSARRSQHVLEHPDASVKNFKKFTKAWKLPTERDIISSAEIHKEDRADDGLPNGFHLRHRDEEEGTARSERRANGLPKARNGDEDDNDEWAFVPFSQV